MRNSFTKLRLLSNKVYFIINTLFPPLREILLAGRLQFFDEAQQPNVLFSVLNSTYSAYN